MNEASTGKLDNRPGNASPKQATPHALLVFAWDCPSLTGLRAIPAPPGP